MLTYLQMVRCKQGSRKIHKDKQIVLTHKPKPKQFVCRDNHAKYIKINYLLWQFR